MTNKLHEGAVTSVLALNFLLAILVGFSIPRPPGGTGRTSKSLSRPVIPCLPVNTSKNLFLIASSSGCSLFAEEVCARDSVHKKPPSVHGSISKDSVGRLGLGFYNIIVVGNSNFCNVFLLKPLHSVEQIFRCNRSECMFAAP